MRNALPRSLPLAFMLTGVALFGASLAALSLEGSGAGTHELEPTTLVVANDSAVILYPVDYHGHRYSRVDVQYEFPREAGEAYFVGCSDAAALERGEAPAAPALKFTHQRSGKFVVWDQTVRDIAALYGGVAPDARDASCRPAVAFRWPAIEQDAALNRPEVAARYYAGHFDGENFLALLAPMAGGPLLALGGGLWWARMRAPASERLPHADHSMAESLRRLMDRMGEQLERTRRHLLFAGFVGIFVWYPLLLPWAWRQARLATDDPVIHWTVTGLAVLFLLVLTFLWAREYVRLRVELVAWRRKIGELRAKEHGFLRRLDADGRW